MVDLKRTFWREIDDYGLWVTYVTLIEFLLLRKSFYSFFFHAGNSRISIKIRADQNIRYVAWIVLKYMGSDTVACWCRILNRTFSTALQMKWSNNTDLFGSYIHLLKTSGWSFGRKPRLRQVSNPLYHGCMSIVKTLFHLHFYPRSPQEKIPCRHWEGSDIWNVHFVLLSSCLKEQDKSSDIEQQPPFSDCK